MSNIEAKNVGDLDKRFAILINHKTHGKILVYPFIKERRDPPAIGFATSAKGKRDRLGEGEYTMDIQEVIKRVVWEQYAVRATCNQTKEKSSYRLYSDSGRGNAVGFWVAPEFRHLVEGFDKQPLISDEEFKRLQD